MGEEIKKSKKSLLDVASKVVDTEKKTSTKKTATAKVTTKTEAKTSVEKDTTAKTTKVAAKTNTKATTKTASKTVAAVKVEKVETKPAAKSKSKATPKATVEVAKDVSNVATKSAKTTKTTENVKTPKKETEKSPTKVSSKTVSKVENSSVTYDEDSILHLEGLEHIRLRPGMYIGSLGDGSNENDGIYILLKEGIDNAVDEFSQGFGNRIDIEIKDGRVKIRDYGRGIPLGKLEDCVSNVNTGAKYNNSVFKQAIGMNGVGIKATNALSSYFRAASVRDGKMAVVEYERGEKKSGNVGNAKPGVKNGTYLEFVPDTQLFGKYQFNMEMVEKRLWNYAYLNPGLLIHCNDKDYISENGLQDLLTHEMGETNKSLYPMYTYQGENLQFVMTHTSSLDKFVYSFVNGQSTEDGGTHVTSFLDGFTKGINDYFKKDYDEKDVTGGILVALKIGLDNPMFTSQTKNKLGNVEVRGPIIKETQFAIDDWLRHNPDIAGALEDKIIRNQKARAEINNVTEKQVREAAKTVS
ncbi:MAG: type IIA DNA topoisomerase subunit B, partial [Treponema sp.]|nr:type IIA DNA topoisomerase subunit B [Treponema sp.]